jgi:intein/homing endonuclease
MPKSGDDFYSVLSAAVDDLTEHGFDSIDRVEKWARLIRIAAERSLVAPESLEERLREGLASIYRKMVENNGLLKFNPGIERFTFERLKPALRPELDRRIMASSNLIRLNRAEAIDSTLRRFQGWATSVPPGGVSAETKAEVRKTVRKGLAQLPFEERRVLIDQGAKLVASINDVIASDGGAIAGMWRSHWRQPGYDYRPDHKDRDEKIYLIRDSWAHRAGLVKPGRPGYVDDITAPAVEPFCRCVPGSTKIPFANVRRIYRRPYHGVLLQITTASGKSLRLTPNHPILAVQGWIAANALNVGDDLVESANEIVQSSAHLNENDAIPEIAQIFEFLQQTGRSSAAVGTGEQFHGDGVANSDVDIVSTDRTLRVGRHSCGLKRRRQFHFANAEFARSAARTLFKHSVRLWLAAMESAHAFCSRNFDICGLVENAKSLSCRTVAQCHSGSLYATSNGVCASAVIGSENIRTSSAEISRDDLAIGKINRVAEIDLGFGFVADCDSRLSKTPTNSSVGNLELLCKHHGIDAATVRFGKVVDIQRNFFAGHVYNLETEEGWYVADGILSHNCYYIYKYNLRDLPEDMLTAKGKKALASVQGMEEVRAARKGRADSARKDAATMSKGEVEYVEFWGDLSTQCQKCSMFVRTDANAPGGHACTLVIGPIQRAGHCERFEAARADALEEIPRPAVGYQAMAMRLARLRAQLEEA